MGDFNLDYNKVYDDNYSYKNLFDDFEDRLSMFNLVQMVNFVTWSRMVGPTVRSSILDHLNDLIPLSWGRFHKLFCALSRPTPNL